MKHAYYLRLGGAPLCDCLFSPDRRKPLQAAKVTSCSYATLADARDAKERLDAIDGWAGSASVHEGRCPRLDETWPDD